MFRKKAEKLQKALEIGERIFKQEKKSKGKIYSIHEAQVECLSKGKAHKRYEFGNKVSFLSDRKEELDNRGKVIFRKSV